MLSRNYTKLIDCTNKMHFPVHLSNDSNYQETVGVSFAHPYLAYELSYVEGATLYSYLKLNADNQSLILTKLNDFIDWYKRVVLFELDGEYILVNGDSNFTNIILARSGFVHIDNQTDFFIHTKSKKRAYYPFLQMASKLKLDKNTLESLSLDADIVEFLLNNQVSEDKLSDYSDSEVFESRDDLYTDIFVQGKASSSILKDILVDNTARYKKVFYTNLYENISMDFKGSSDFYRNHLSTYEY